MRKRRTSCALVFASTLRIFLPLDVFLVGLGMGVSLSSLVEACDNSELLDIVTLQHDDLCGRCT